MSRKEQIIFGVSGLIIAICACVAAWIVVPPSLISLRSNANTPLPTTIKTPLKIATGLTEASKEIISSPTTQPTETSVSEIQPSGYVFFDDFENALSSQWKVQYGQLDMFDGKLTVVDQSRTPNAYHYITLDKLYWKDLTIEIELAPFDGAFYGGEADSIGAIVVHQNNDTPSVGLRFYTARDGLQFGTISTEGEWLLPTSLVDGFANDFTLHDRVHTIKVVVKGLSYTAYIDNRKITSTSIPGSEVRTVGLWFKTSTVDKPDFFAPRIESIKITAN